MGAGKRGIHGVSSNGPHFMQTAQVAAETDLRPENDVAAWHTWEGLRVPGRHCLGPPLPPGDMIVYRKPVLEDVRRI